MTRTDLLDLAERVEAGSGEDLRLACDIYKCIPSDLWGRDKLLTSLDAVEALRERLLPGSNPEGGQRSDGSWFAYCAVPSAKKYEGERVWRTHGAKAPTEPRARLAALLRAYAEMTGG